VGRRFSALLVFAYLMTACLALPPKVHHPLDALTPDEYWSVYRALRDAGHVNESTVFTSVLFHEPLKKDVLNWKPGDPISRKADVVLF
jgi:primary-amine oxidase